ncbi:uncharacterized protein NECHADRAFT_86231 [Fusarium vanettenii 77-13-4]|uniref:Uncharacterized protein n=1 Tax=Fusarium vanettenii (strain ATCC MYA-4622 / CBS 123669 / FGSC 9596 / NRRL 45880 / 77-13-4) TaxID=660122 RepID=C7ZKQ1_FUSV7|nr:uncharacterized protein NECHADRAFT_86231 [Fusarium vanettenii 77-13-4]EEU35442.1 hypothetical protein NECHADRAFT_86231 [Fusarium vanettenii 77-13-4]
MKNVQGFKIDDWVRVHGANSRFGLEGSYVSALSMNDLQQLSTDPTLEVVNRDMEVSYGSFEGSLELREGIAALNSSEGSKLTAENVIITPLSIMANYLVLDTICQSRACKKSVAGPNPSNGPGLSMRPRANTISHVDSSTMKMIAAANASVQGGIPPTYTHSRRLSLAGLPIPSLDRGILATMGQRGLQHGLPKLETSTLGSLDFSNGLRTAPPVAAAFNTEFDFEGLFGSGSTINPDALHYNRSPQLTALEQASPFAPPMNETPSRQTLDDSFDGLTGFEH